MAQEITEFHKVKKVIKQKGKAEVKKAIDEWSGNPIYSGFTDLKLKTIANVTLKPLATILKKLNALPDK